MASCSIRWCGKNSKTSNFKTDGITFHRFPQQPDLKEKWVNATKRENWIPTEYSIVCSKHFTDDCFYATKCRRRLFKTAIPTQHLPLLIGVSGFGRRDCASENFSPIQSSSSHFEPMRTTVMLTKLKSTKPDNVLEINSSIQNDTTLPKCTPSNSNPILSSLLQSEQIATTLRGNKRKATDPENPSQFCSPTKKRLCRHILDLKNQVTHKNKTIKVLRDKVRYYKKRVESLKVILNELEKKCLKKAEDADI